MKKIIVSSIIIASTFVACKTGEKVATAPVVPLDCSTKMMTYATDIQPIMEQYCTRCHNTNEKAGYNFKELSFVKKAASSGVLLGTIKHTKGYPKMPYYAAKLDQSNIDKIECWINNGMKE